jgi:hypothetical protein
MKIKIFVVKIAYFIKISMTLLVIFKSCENSLYHLSLREGKTLKSLDMLQVGIVN